MQIGLENSLEEYVQIHYFWGMEKVLLPKTAPIGYPTVMVQQLHKLHSRTY